MAEGDEQPKPDKAGENSRDSKSKDFWDKFSSMNAFLSTVLVAVVGGIFTYLFNAREAAHQHNIQETQTVAQLMPYLTSQDQNTKRTALIAVKVLQDASLMVNLAASDPDSPGSRRALRDVAYHSPQPADRKSALDILAQFEFAPACNLPFQDIGVSHSIDQSCGMFGNSPFGSSMAQQNFVKNDFCAGPEYKRLALGDFVKLQDEAQNLGNGPTHLLADRSALNRLGEGSAVSFVGYINNAHYADVRGGESVNCKTTGQDANDIHVSLAAKSDETDECQSIVAEISPHMRPAKWEADSLQALAQSHALVRFSGQLFFDGSHQPCRGGHPMVPKRASVWEIHPVYAIEICRDAQQGACRNEAWSALEPAPQ